MKNTKIFLYIIALGFVILAIFLALKNNPDNVRNLNNHSEITPKTLDTTLDTTNVQRLDSVDIQYLNGVVDKEGHAK